MSRKGRQREREGRPSPNGYSRARKGEEPLMSSEQLVTEGRRARLAGVAGTLAVVSIIASLTAARSLVEGAAIDLEGGADVLEGLRQFQGSRETVAAVYGFQSLAYLLLIPFGLFLWSACRARRPEVSRWLARASVLIPALAALSGVVAFLALSGVVAAFLAATDQTEATALALTSESGLLRISSAAAETAPWVVGVWVAWLAYELMRTGLTTRSVAVFGIAAAVVPIIAPAVGTGVLIGWAGSVAIILFGYWPGGRPPAWEAGRPLPPDV
ncbi:MAG: hypothetical protein H0U42_00665 [Thermoleophilaceae bacterium]|nr:hypothetical protein [Thermoleophilaceae bacterium]